MLLPSGALAADLPLKAPPKVVWDSWAGPYIGAYVAAGTGRARELADESEFHNTVNTLTNLETSRSTVQSSGDFTGTATGSMVDLFAGYNWQRGNFVVGGQVEATVLSDVDLNAFGSRTMNTARFSNGVVIQAASRIATTGNDPQLQFKTGLIGRAGFLARPNLLLYGLAGIEFGHFVFPDDDDLFGSSNRKWAVGYTAGAGAEARLDDRWSLRAEYRYLHFDINHSEATRSTPSLAAQNLTFIDAFAASRANHADLHLGTIGLVYRFGETGPLLAMAAMVPAQRTLWADSWAGPYVGVYLGAGAGHAAETFARPFNSQSSTAGNISTSSQAVSGSFAGDMTGSMNDLFLGYNWRQGNFVAGAQLEGTLFSDVGLKVIGPQTSISSSATNGVPNGPSSFTVGGSQSNQLLRSSVGLIGRAGLLATPNLLLYGLGGLELGHFVYPVGRVGLGGDNGKWVAGYTAGVGGEMRIDDHWSLRGEYRYMHFDVSRNEAIPSSTVDLLTGATSTSLTSTVRQTAADIQLGKVGVVYKFGSSGPASAMAAIPRADIAAWNDGWAGPYLGAYFGAGAGHARESYTAQFAANGVNAQSENGALAGGMSGSQADLFTGYNIRNGRFVFGGQIEATQFSDVAAKTIGIRNVASADNSFGIIQTVQNNHQLRSMVGVIGRAGFLATPDLLLYGLGGLALGHFTYPDGGDQTGEQNGRWVTGYTVGAGGELKVSSHWSLRAEYRYLNFGHIDRDMSTPALSGSISNGVTTILSNSSSTLSRQTSADFHLGKVGLAYQFGAGPASAMAAVAVSSADCCDRWTGAYAGVYAAGGRGRVRDAMTSNSNSSEVFLPPPPQIFAGSVDSASGNLAGDVTGGMVDLFAGYNWRVGQFVVGGQAEGTIFGDVVLKSRGNIVGTSTSLIAPVTIDPTNDAVENQQLLRSRFGLIGRAGFLATPNLLLYGLGGLEFGHFMYPDRVDPVGGENGKWAIGYTAGAGAELKLTDRWSLRGEYRYLRFKVARSTANTFHDTDFVNSADDSTFGSTTRTTVDFHVGKIGVVYGFCYCD